MDHPRLTPYDTGARCEPRLWQPDAAAIADAMQDDEGQDIGNVDFDDEEGHTIVTVHVSRNDDGTHTIHVIPFVDESDLEVKVHSEEVD